MQKIKWSNIPRGFAMGTSDLIPGVSGGTIALLLGIYDDFISSISGIFSKQHFLKSLRFLIPIIIGMGIALGLLSKLINYLLAEHHVVTMFFFLGLITGIVPFLLKESQFRIHFKAQHYSVIALGIIFIVVLTLFQGGDKHDVNTLALTPSSTLIYLIAGICASSAMLLPGISGSFVLLLFGAYGTVMYAVSEMLSFNFQALPLLLTVVAGVLIGFLASSRLIHYLLAHYTHMTYALIIGFVVGSLYAIFPGMPANGIEWLFVIITFIVGFCVSWLIGRQSHKQAAH